MLLLVIGLSIIGYNILKEINNVTVDKTETDLSDLDLIQEKKNPIINDFVFGSIKEEMPRFPGCEKRSSRSDKISCAQKKFLEYIYSNLRYPKLAKESSIEGKCIVSFYISETGIINDIKLIRDIGAGCGQASIEVVEKMKKDIGKWIPGQQRGKAVKVLYTLPVKFDLS